MHAFRNFGTRFGATPRLYSGKVKMSQGMVTMASTLQPFHTHSARPPIGLLDAAWPEHSFCRPAHAAPKPQAGRGHPTGLLLFSQEQTMSDVCDDFLAGYPFVNLHGPRRVGKSLASRHLPVQRLAPGARLAFCDLAGFQPFATADQLVQQILRVLWFTSEESGVDSLSRDDNLVRFLESMRRRGWVRRLVVVLDHVDSLSIALGYEEMMRWLQRLQMTSQRLPWVQWLLVSHTPLSIANAAWHTLSDTLRSARLGLLSPDSETLLCRMAGSTHGLSFDESALALLSQWSGGHPVVAQRIIQLVQLSRPESHFAEDAVEVNVNAWALQQAVSWCDLCRTEAFEEIAREIWDFCAHHSNPMVRASARLLALHPHGLSSQSLSHELGVSLETVDTALEPLVAQEMLDTRLDRWTYRSGLVRHAFACRLQQQPPLRAKGARRAV
jgi:hypothetical protein